MVSRVVSSFGSRPVRTSRPRRGRALRAIVIASGVVLRLGSAVEASAQAVGTEAYAEWVVTHTDRIASGLVATTGSDPGQSNPTSVSITGQHLAAYGQHDLQLSAFVDTLANGSPRLRGFAEHVFLLTGISPTSDGWNRVDGRMKVRAQVSDVLSIVGIGGVPAEVELFFELDGQVDATLDLLPGQSVIHTFQTPVRLIGTTQLPQSGGGTQTTTTSWGGSRSQDLAETKTVERQVALRFDLDDPNAPLGFQIALEIEPITNLRNGLDGPGATTVSGLHRASFNGAGAELVGIVIRDAAGNILGDSTASASSGFVYPVLDEVPPPRVPEWTIRSPLSITASDLGDASATYPKTKMIDRSGLAKPFTSGVTSYDDYVSTLPAPNHVTTAGNQWISPIDTSLPLQGYVDFDLGATFVFDEIALWQVSLKDVTILVADNPLGPWTAVGQFLPPSHTSFFGSYPIDRLDLQAEVQGRYLRLQINDCHKFSASDTFASANVGEIALRTKVVPEPGLVGMLGAGAVLLAGVARRRRLPLR